MSTIPGYAPHRYWQATDAATGELVAVGRLLWCRIAAWLYRGRHPGRRVFIQPIP